MNEVDYDARYAQGIPITGVRPTPETGSNSRTADTVRLATIDVTKAPAELLLQALDKLAGLQLPEQLRAAEGGSVT